MHYYLVKYYIKNEYFCQSILAYVAIVHGVRLLGANTVYRWDANVFAPFHRAMFELYPL